MLRVQNIFVKLYKTKEKKVFEAKARNILKIIRDNLSDETYSLIHFTFLGMMAKKILNP